MIINQNGIFFKLNQNDFTAEIIKSDDALGNIFIPQAIKFDNHDFVITTIGQKSFASNYNITAFQFADDSKLELIEKEAFSCSSIVSISIPQSIKKIGKDAFSYCKDLKTVYFPKDCNLITIDEATFYNSSINTITVPRYVKFIKQYSFSYCFELQTINFCQDSDLISIEKDAFLCSSISNLFIPSKVEEIKDGWCSGTPKLLNISISPQNKNFLYLDNKLLLCKSDQQQDTYDKIIFARRDIESVVIPSFVKFIASYSFHECQRIKSVEFPEDSQLMSIGESSFSISSIETISIPRHVKIIKKNTFSFCPNLKTINFSEDSEVQKFENDCFTSSSINNIIIPSKVEEIEGGWFHDAPKSLNISISEKNKNFLNFNNELIIGKIKLDEDVFDKIIFAKKNIKKIVIPSFIKCIGPYSFSECYFLKSIEFSEDSQLNSIEENAFLISALENISIPSNVSFINDNAFNLNYNLRSFEFLGEHFDIHLLFLSCSSLFILSFPNASYVNFSIPEFLDDFTLFVRSDANFNIAV